ncbi:hypothetical protein D3C78_615730 [compost metagenome]
MQLALQYRIGSQLHVELQQRDMGHDTGQVDGRFDAGVAAANHRHALALEQRAVAMRAVRHALVAVLLLARHVHFTPPRTGRQNHGPGLQRCAAGEVNLVQLAILAGYQFVGTLQVHDVHVVLLDVFFQGHGQFRAFGFLHRDKVLNGHGVQHLATKTFGRDTGANAFTGRVDCRRSTGRATADHQHVKGFFGADLLGLAFDAAGVDLGEDFFQAHAALTEVHAIEVDAWDRHDLALIDFSLEQRAVDGDVANVRVQYRHQVQRLDHVRAVLAGQREVSLEVELAFERADLFDHFGTGLRRVAADLQQGQHQRSEFVAHRDAGETQADIGTRAIDRERWLACIVTVVEQSNLAGKTGNVFQQFKHFLGFRTVVEGGNDLDRLGDPFQVRFQLGFKIGVQHTGDFLFAFAKT